MPTPSARSSVVSSTQPGILDGLGAAGRQRILSGFTWEAAATIAGERLTALSGRTHR